MNHVAILLHRDDNFDNPPYLLNEIAKIWRENGLRVTVLHGPGSHLDADMAVLHVDLTVIPDDYLKFVRQCPVVINGAVADISKRFITTNLVCYGDGYQGEVIVKSNLNCGGDPESKFFKKGPFLQRCEHSLRNKMPWTFRSLLSASEYRILKSSRHVPRPVWNNPYLVVERFLPEFHDGYYCLRTWLFFGDKEVNSLFYSHQPIIKSHNVVHREIVAEAPEELRQIRKKLGFDYGKFDYAIVDGRVVLYDANRTPTMGRFSKEQVLPRIILLAEGIRAYL